MPDEFKIIFRSHPKLLKPIRGLIRNYLELVGIDKDRIDEVVLGLDEACTNCIRHAYRGIRNGLIEIIARTGNKWVEFELHDCGRCPPSGFLSSSNSTKMDRQGMIKPHGLGLTIIQKVFDDVRFYVDSKGQNCLVLRLRKGNSAEGLGHDNRSAVG